MYKRLQYLLYLLILTLTCHVSREYSAVIPAVPGTDNIACLCAGANTCENNTSILLVHLLCAPDIAAAVSTDPSSKAPAQHLMPAGYSSHPHPSSGIAPHLQTIDLHPDTVGYYVFTLGKIVI